MLGLAVGSRSAARSAWLRRAPLTAYSGLELGIALYALAFPLLVGALEALYPALFRLLEGHPLALSAARFVLAFVLLLPPTFLMGASLPAMAEAVVAPPGQLARRVAWLYALNTVGGVAGTLVAGFLLIEHLGVTRSLYVGSAGSALVAAAAFALARHPEDLMGRGPSRHPEDPVGRSRGSAAGRALGAVRSGRIATSAALVAGCLVASEIVWTRALVFFVHNSTYALSAIVRVPARHRRRFLLPPASRAPDERARSPR
jgi:spermidine synthase